MRRLLALAMLLPCCAEIAPPPSQQGTAMSAILATYAAPAALGAPDVRWQIPEAECQGTAWTLPWAKAQDWYKPGTACIRGLFDRAQPREIQAVLPGSALDAIAVTAMAHETAHWFLFATTGDDDGEHKGPYFAKGGPVEVAATAALQAIAK